MKSPGVGRFAPSPTGPLHLGSLLAATGSYLHARAMGGQWLVRMEDVDTERNVPGADSEILRALEAFGFEWDGPVLRQTARLEAYLSALDALRARGVAYPCACSRSEIERAALAAGAPRAVDGGWVYPGRCRDGLAAGQAPRAWRFRVPATAIGFDDLLQGHVQQVLATDVGDFVLKRADGPFAYQLAVVVDDAYQGVTHVVRGVDLLDSTPRQMALQQGMGLPTPIYAHLPVVVNADGAKLSKQTRAPALDCSDPRPELLRVLGMLGIQLPADAMTGTVSDIWRGALADFPRAWGHLSGRRTSPV